MGFDVGDIVTSKEETQLHSLEDLERHKKILEIKKLEKENSPFRVSNIFGMLSATTPFVLAGFLYVYVQGPSASISESNNCINEMTYVQELSDDDLSSLAGSLKEFPFQCPVARSLFETRVELESSQRENAEQLSSLEDSIESYESEISAIIEIEASNARERGTLLDSETLETCIDDARARVFEATSRNQAILDSLKTDARQLSEESERVGIEIDAELLGLDGRIAGLGPMVRELQLRALDLRLEIEKVTSEAETVRERLEASLDDFKTDISACFSIVD